MLSGQVWRFLPPAATPPAKPPGSPAEAVEAVASAHLFAVAAPGSLPKEPALSTSYRLLGVIAAGKTPSGMAVLQAGSGPPMAIAVGAELEKGVTLRAVEAHGVSLDERGREVRLFLPEPSSGKQ